MTFAAFVIDTRSWYRVGHFIHFVLNAWFFGLVWFEQLTNVNRSAFNKVNSRFEHQVGHFRTILTNQKGGSWQKLGKNSENKVLKIKCNKVSLINKIYAILKQKVLTNFWLKGLKKSWKCFKLSEKAANFALTFNLNLTYTKGQ